jgi:tetratricopeptide (TPR) repeat protein
MIPWNFSNSSVASRLGPSLWALLTSMLLVLVVGCASFKAQVHYDLAVALVAKGDNDGAMAEYRMAISLRPDWAEAHHNLGDVLDARGDLAGAIGEFREAVRLKPDFAEAHYDLAVEFEKKGDWRTALGYGQKALQLEPSNPDYRAVFDRLERETRGR